MTVVGQGAAEGGSADLQVSRDRGDGFAACAAGAGDGEGVVVAGGRADRTWGKRLAELTRSAVLDDFAMRGLTAAQADDLYELIIERAGRSRCLAIWTAKFPLRPRRR